MISDNFLLNLQDLGVAGIFILYLIYDRQVLLKKLTKTIDEMNLLLNKLIVKVTNAEKEEKRRS